MSGLRECFARINNHCPFSLSAQLKPRAVHVKRNEKKTSLQWFMSRLVVPATTTYQKNKTSSRPLLPAWLAKETTSHSLFPSPLLHITLAINRLQCNPTTIKRRGGHPSTPTPTPPPLPPLEFLLARLLYYEYSTYLLQPLPPPPPQERDPYLPARMLRLLLALPHTPRRNGRFAATALRSTVGLLRRPA